MNEEINEAWAEYDVNTGSILRISWKDPNVITIKITEELAISFITGQEKFLDWNVEGIGVLPVLKKRVDDLTSTPLRQFWNLKKLDGTITSTTVSINDNYLKLDVELIKHNTMLYITLKNDPSWLLESWRLSELPVIYNQIICNIEFASNFSFYIG